MSATDRWTQNLEAELGELLARQADLCADDLWRVLVLLARAAQHPAPPERLESHAAACHAASTARHTVCASSLRCATDLTSPAKRRERTSFSPPALPRPPAWICAFTTHSSVLSASYAATASSTLTQKRPSGTAKPAARKSSFA